MEGVRLHARDPHHVPPGLLHAAREQRREVGAAGRQHQAVHRERLRAHLQPHVAEALPGAQPVDLGQEEAGMPLGTGDGAGARGALARPGTRRHRCCGTGTPRRRPRAAHAPRSARPGACAKGALPSEGWARWCGVEGGV